MAAVVFYDGVCGLCNRLVRFLIRRDHEGRLLFAPLQGNLAQTILEPYGYDPSDLNTVYVVADWREPSQSVLARSRAILHALAELGGAWRVVAALAMIIPSRFSDTVYNAVARRRYRTFGELDACPVPPPEWRGRFIE